MTNRTLQWLRASLAGALLVSCASVAQQMTPEQQALYDEMIRNAGGDPEQVRAASAQAQVAQQYGERVRYSVLGVYQRQTNVSGDQNWLAYADVTDRVQLQFDWKVTEANFVGAPAIQNFKATLANPRNPEKKCAPPKVSGALEYDVKKLEPGYGGALRMHIQTTFPPVQVHQLCTGPLKSINSRQVVAPIEIMVPPPTMLAMTLPANADVTRSADGKSLVLRKDGWTWTFTPRAGR